MLSGVTASVIPSNEADRIAAVRRYGILDTPPDGAFDRITAIAARLFHVPIAIVSVVDTDRIWFKSHHGLPEVTEIGRDPGLCASAILQDGPWVVADASQDVRTLANPLVAGSFGLRFYAGVPLTTRDGYNLGTLCVLDTEPREVSDDELETLADLAAVVTAELDLRLEARRTVGAESRLRREAEELAGALQASLLPPRPPELPGMELATRYRPGERGVRVGGDFFDVFRLAANDWGIVVGDVCGKGARAASLTGLVRWTIRAAAVRNFPPTEALRDLNAVLLGDDKADDHFCSVVFARLELDTCGAWVTLASAGHPLPLLLRSSGRVTARGHSDLPLGMFDFAAPRVDRIGVGPGDALVFYTDGITEARGPAGDLFGEERLTDVIAGCRGCSADEIAQRIVDAAGQFASGELRDDVAILVVRVPDDAGKDPMGRVVDAIGLPAGQLHLPSYPHDPGGAGCNP